MRRFVADRVMLVAHDVERDDKYPHELVAEMARPGLLGITIPESYGGLGLNLRPYTEIIEELSAGWMSRSGVINTHLIATSPLLPTERTTARALAAAHGHRKIEGLSVAVGARRGQRYGGDFVPCPARRGRSSVFDEIKLSSV